MNSGILPLYLLSVPIEFVWNLLPTIGVVILIFAALTLAFFGVVGFLLALFIGGGLFLVFGVLGVPVYILGFFVLWFLLVLFAIGVFILSNIFFGIFGNFVFIAVITVVGTIAFILYLIFGFWFFLIWLGFALMFAGFSFFIGTILSLPTAIVMLFQLGIIAIQDTLIFFS